MLNSDFSNPFDDLFPLLKAQDKKTEQMKSGVTHLTIKWLLELVPQMNPNTKEIKIGGRPLRLFCLVGRVVQSKLEPTFKHRLDIILEDSTAIIPIVCFCNNEKGFPGKVKSLNFSKPNLYIKAICKLKCFDRPQINLYQAEEIKDFNEVTHHYLRSAFAKLSLGKPRVDLKQEEFKEAEACMPVSSGEGNNFLESKEGGYQGFGRPNEGKEDNKGGEPESFRLTKQENKMMLQLSMKVSAAGKTHFNVGDAQQFLGIQSMDDCHTFLSKLEINGFCHREGKTWIFSD